LKKRVTYIVSDIDKAIAYEWISLLLDKNKFNLSFILLNNSDSYLENFLIKNKIPLSRIQYNKGVFQTLISVYKYLKTNKPDIVNCNNREAEKFGITVAFLLGIKNRIYTRHSSTYNHLYHKKGVLIDKITNTLSTKIIAITENVKNVLIKLENVPESKIELLHHGFDLEMFANIKEEEVNELKKKYQIDTNKKYIGVISRLTWWKGYEYSIPAIGKIIEKHPEFHLLVANANGNNDEKIAIKKLINQHIPTSNYTEIVFENNLAALYQLLNYYVHVPFDAEVEAFGQTYVEALAAGIPSVFTLSGIAPEFIEDRNNALVVPFKNTNAIYDALEELINNDTLAKELIENGKKSVKQFNIQHYIQKLESIYSKM
jgi:glycosyltransferase involved in cell wall biosynthesis